MKDMGGAILVLPSRNNKISYTIEGGRPIMHVPEKRYYYLKNDLNADKLYIIYEDENNYIIAGIKDNNITGITKISKIFFQPVKAIIKNIL